MEINLNIAGYSILFSEKKNARTDFWPQWVFEPFLTENPHPDLHFEITLKSKLPEIPHGNLVFNANDGLWKLFKTRDGYFLETYHTKTLKPYTRALIASDFTHIKLFVVPTYKKGVSGGAWTPMKIFNPVMEICLITKLAREGGVLMHSSGVETRDGVLVFCGPSGTGKSTLADFFRARGHNALSDERIILRKTIQGITAYGTPWPGSSRTVSNSSGPLTALSFIQHGTGKHRLQKASSLEIYSTFFQQCFLPSWDKAAMDRTVQFLDEIIAEVPIFSFAPLKEPDVVNFILDTFPKNNSLLEPQLQG